MSNLFVNVKAAAAQKLQAVYESSAVAVIDKAAIRIMIVVKEDFPECLWQPWKYDKTAI